MCTLGVTIKNAYEILYSSLFSHVLASHGVNGDSDVNGVQQTPHQCSIKKNV